MQASCLFSRRFELSRFTNKNKINAFYYCPIKNCTKIIILSEEAFFEIISIFALSYDLIREQVAGIETLNVEMPAFCLTDGRCLYTRLFVLTLFNY